MRAAGTVWVEWPTLFVLLVCYAVWMLATTALAEVSLAAAVVAAMFAIALHSSLQHEMIHGHPTRWRWLNDALVFPALTLFIPYDRFRATHMAHHMDSRLTDPYDDPESNYLDPAAWNRLSRPVQALLRFNNTLAGRLLVGPAISQVRFMAEDFRAILRGDRAVLAGWLWHVPAVALVLAWLAAFGRMPFWAYLIAAYGGLSLLKIRTFLEHQAHANPRGRTVVIEDRGPLAFLFLNNNLHVVHHMHPRVPWYRLPRLYFADRDRYLKRNEGYRYSSYGEVFRRYLLRRKDPVAHPLWRQD